MTVKLAPIFNDAQLGADGLPLSGGLLTWYLAGTSTPITTYINIAGVNPQTNPIVLNIRGEPDYPIWLTTGNTYKAVLTDSVGTPIRTVDDLSAINDTSVATISEWVLFAGAATYINATSFSLVGDQTNLFDVNRRTRATVSGGDAYSTIITSTYSSGTGKTTLVIANDAVPLDSGLLVVYYGFLDPAHPSFNTASATYATTTSNLNGSWNQMPAGTRLPFAQAAAPTGWTQDTTDNATNRMLRVVNTTGNGVGGSASPILNNTVPSHTHTFTGTALAAHTHTDAGHSHSIETRGTLTQGGPNATNAWFNVSATSTGTGFANISSVSAGTPAGTNATNAGAIDWTPRYIDMIICAKN